MTARHIKKKTVSYATALALLLGMGAVIPATSASASAPGSEDCLPAVLMLRGSGEPQLDEGSRIYPQGAEPSSAFITTNGHEGETIGRVLERLTAQTDPDETTARLRFIGIDYPALAVFPEIEPLPSLEGLSAMEIDSIREAKAIETGGAIVSHTVRYLSSINRGAANAKAVIDADLDRGCDTQYMLMGYSQGAFSARQTMNLLGNNTDKIISSYLIGDPLQKGATDWSPNQITPATTSFEDGLVRDSLTKLIAVAADAAASGDPKALSTGVILKALYDDLMASDETAYRNSSDEEITSRFLCHDKDSVCWNPVLLSDSDQHTNYFKDGTDPGILDSALETPEFDLQLRALANSQPGTLRERFIKASAGALGDPVIYNVVNARNGDNCSWDQGSDGSFESTASSCRDYEVLHEGYGTAKMTVKVLDAFNIERIYSTEDEVLSPKDIAELFGVPYDEWLRFESVANPEDCVTIPQRFDRTFSGGSGIGMNVSSCLESPSKNFEADPRQVFKRVTPSVESGGYDAHYLWGYDESYRIQGESGGPVAPYASPRDLPDDGNSLTELKLAQIRDGVPYYQFQMNWVSNAMCAAEGMAADELVPCDVRDERTLFRAVPVEGDYGSLTLEGDVTPPSEVVNFRLDSRDGDYGSFSWDASTDDRTDAISYYKIERYEEIFEEWQFSARVEDGATSVADAYLSGFAFVDSKPFRISACDYSDNCSVPTEIQIPKEG